MNAILTAATGQEFCRDRKLQIFFKSLKQTGYKDKIIVFTHSMDQDIQDLLTQGYGVELVEIDLTQISQGDYRTIWRDRHLLYHQYLLNKNYEKVLITDSKDVYFQTNPFNNTPKKSFIWLGAEGNIQINSPWNTEDQEKAQHDLIPAYQRDLAQQPILNAGFFMGSRREIQNLCLTIWSQTLRSQQKYTDQAVLNYLYYFLKNDPIYKVHTPQESKWIITGHGIELGWTADQCEWRDNLLYHKTLNQPFAAFHQWDRTPHQREIMIKMGFYVGKTPEPNFPRVCPKSFETVSLKFRKI